MKGFITVADTHRYVTDVAKLWVAEKSAPQTPKHLAAEDIVLARYV